jgi:hypothetical protein
MDIITNIKEWFFSYKKDKNIIIDPISCLVKLSILSLYPKGTKISISNNGLSFNNSTIFQGSIRFIQGDCREDLHNIFKPIQKSIEWYWNTEEYGKTIEELFHMSELGLINLKNCYEANSTIQHSLDYYISYIKNKNYNKDNLHNKNEYKSNELNNEKQEKTIIYNYLKKMWSKREINIVIQLFQEYYEKDSQDEKENIINNINNMTTTKEKLLADFIREQCSSL